MNSEVVHQYAEAMREESQFPPVDLFFDGETYYIGDGFHRVHAAIECGLEVIWATVREGTMGDAIDFSCSANKTHGLHRTNADKRRAAETMLQRHASWSNRRIADHVGVSNHLVADVRAELQESNDALAVPMREGADGRVRTSRRPSGGTTFNPEEWEGDEDEADEESDDQVGELPVEDPLAELKAEFKAIVNSLNEAARLVNRLAGERPRGNHLKVSQQGIIRDIRGAKSMVKMLMPAAECGCENGCDRCRRSGHLTQQQVDTLEQAQANQ